MWNILVLCTGNSARSILGEALFNHLGAGRVQAYSAGSKPKGAPHPGALRWLAGQGIDPAQFRSKSWDEFSASGAPAINLAITVCGNAAGEACPLFVGAPLRGHWGLPDPADVTQSDAAVDAAFAETARLLSDRINALLALDFETMVASELRTELARIGAMAGAA